MVQEKKNEDKTLGAMHLKNEQKTEEEMESGNTTKKDDASFMKTKVVLYWSHGTEKLNRMPIKDNLGWVTGSRSQVDKT